MLTEDQARVALATASALAVVTASRSNAAGSGNARMSVAQFQAMWNESTTRPAVDAVLRARGIIPVIPDQLVTDGTYGGNTARALFATFFAFDRANVRTAAQWSSDMTGITTWTKLEQRATALDPVLAANDVRDSSGIYLVSAAGSDIYRIVITTPPASILAAVRTRLVTLKTQLGPTSAQSAVNQASSQGQNAVNAANAPAMAPTSASTDANATVATARVQGDAAVAAANTIPSTLPATTGTATQTTDANLPNYHGPETLYGPVSGAHKVPTAVWIGGGALVLFGLGYAVIRATEKRA